ncbi:OLC1v1008086C1 [Oldenlandia corymbosa var. corymbosa]|uniref:OLC1v1008086C1 n=1 Tax=Oldenlandia corymbosa var. corymbosa TaxID=529605 RepID=A0AAV1DKT1_OLDCO|nr:OLC1v1008086C1 [Oldenlandia corymbosa var. corymbosa]
MAWKTFLPSSPSTSSGVRKEGDESHMLCLLPQEILELIESYLFIGDRLAFKATCQATKLLQNPPLTYEKSKHCPYFSCPKLILRRNDDDVQLFDFAYNSLYVSEIPEFKDAEIRCSKYGWLLMSNGNSKSLFLFNPFTNQKRIDIPWITLDHVTAMSFDFPPTSSSWSVFGVFYHEEGELAGLISVANVKSGKRSQNWRVRNIFKKPDNFQVSTGALVSHNDRYYFLDVKGRVALFDPEHRRQYFYSQPIGFRDVNSENVNQSFLVAGLDGGDVFAVIVSHDATKVSVYKLNPGNKRWVRVESLENIMVFVSVTSSFWAKAAEKWMGNKIYFPKFHGENGIFYSLTTQKYHSYDGRFSTQEPSQLIDMDSATWIQPYL